MAETRKQVPRGGTVVLPSPYDKKPSYPTYGERSAERFLTGYRHWRSTMSGYPECDGMVTVALTSEFKGLEDFVLESKSALSVSWTSSENIPGQPWDGNEKKFERVKSVSALGPDLTQQLSLHTVGFWDVLDLPGYLYALEHKAGITIAIWNLNKHGGLKKAKAIVQKIGASYQA